MKTISAKNSLALAVLGANLLLGAPYAQADEVIPEFDLGTIVVTATRTEMSLKETPSSVEVVDHKRLEK